MTSFLYKILDIYLNLKELYGYKYHINPESPSKLIKFFDNKLSDNIDDSSSSQLLSCQYVNNNDVNFEDIYKKNIHDTQVPRTNTFPGSHKEQIRKECDSNLLKEELEQAQILIAEAENDLVL